MARPQRYVSYFEVTDEMYKDPLVDKDKLVKELFDRHIAVQRIQRHEPWEITWSRSFPRTFRKYYPWYQEVLIWVANLFGKHPEQFITTCDWWCLGTTMASKIEEIDSVREDMEYGSGKTEDPEGAAETRRCEGDQQGS